jgi:hypothetical protein
MVSASIGNSGESVRAIGAFRYTNTEYIQLAPGMLIDYLRVSDTARYSGGTLEVPLDRELISDAATQLLYHFNEPAGSSTVTDASPLGLHGALGVSNFDEATAPELGHGPVCATDLDQSGSTDIQDLLDLLGAWGSCGDSCCPGDLVPDGVVGIQDLLVILAEWGPCS